MSIKNPDVVIMSGGKGTRIGSLALLYGCKSLIPIAGWPTIEYVIKAIRLVTNGRIFLCIERPELFPEILAQIQRLEIKNAEVYLDTTMRGTMHAIYKLKDRLATDNILVVYGHHLIKTQHLQKMIDRNEKGVIVSLYKTSSNNPRDFANIDKDGRAIDILRGNESMQLQNSQYFIDPPYLFPREYVRIQQDRAIRSHDAIKEGLMQIMMFMGILLIFHMNFIIPQK